MNRRFKVCAKKVICVIIAGHINEYQRDFERASLQPQLTFTGMTALVVDDNKGLRRMVASCLQRIGLSVVEAENCKDAYDVAFIVVAENITDIAEAEIDLNKVQVADPLIVGGYGCEDRLGGATPNPRRYKVGETYAVDIDKLKGARGNYSDINVQRNIYTHNILTAAQKINSSVPSICPGDSGGPVYRANDHLAIVGVNSYYSFNDESGISATNWHTRLANLKIWVLQIVDARGE